MTFYQELQLNQAGSKLMIQEAVGRRAKAWHLLVYLVKILLTMVFCVAFVTLYGWVFGAENNIVGVVVLLCLMVFRQADLGMRRGQSLLALGTGCPWPESAGDPGAGLPQCGDGEPSDPGAGVSAAVWL